MKKDVILKATIAIILLLNCSGLMAENLQKNSTAEVTEKHTGRNATKAIIYSAIIPGGGQVYNNDYLKAGIAMGVELTFLGSGIYYQVQSNKAWDDYEESGNQQDYNQYNDYHLKSQSMYWWFFSVKFLSVVDAYVDAKLFNYDKKKRKLDLELGNNSISLNYKF